jgi:hypothetical protein
VQDRTTESGNRVVAAERRGDASRIIPSKYDLMEAHRYLMAEYAVALRKVGALNAFVSRQTRLLRLPDNPRRSDRIVLRLSTLSLLRWRFLIRILVESHIKSRLNRIAIGYIQLEQLAGGPSGNNDLARWLQEADSEIKRFTGTLAASRSLRSILAVWLPAILVPIYAVLGVSNLAGALPKIFDIVRPNFTVVFNIAFLLSLLLLYFVIPLPIAFLYKRSLFIPGNHLLRTWLNPEDDLYKAEDRLSKLLHIRKRREFPIDALLVVWMTVEFSILWYGMLGFLPPPLHVVILIGGCLLVLWMSARYYVSLVWFRAR